MGWVTAETLQSRGAGGPSAATQCQPPLQLPGDRDSTPERGKGQRDSGTHWQDAGTGTDCARGSEGAPGTLPSTLS